MPRAIASHPTEWTTFRQRGRSRGAVYVPRRARVKWFGWASRGLRGLAVALVAAGWPGCSQSALPVATARAAHPIGIWYSLELAASAPAGLEQTLQRDFANLQTMGINTVLVQHCDPRDAAALLSAARSTGRDGAAPLRLIIADPVAMRYLRTGWRGSGWFSPLAQGADREVMVGRYIGRVVDDVTLERARRLADAARQADPPLPLAVELDDALHTRLRAGDADRFAYLIWRAQTATASAPADADSAPGTHTVPCTRGGESHSVRAWLAGYHLGLARGQTAGVVFDTYRSLPASVRGVVVAGESLSPECIAIVRRIADRSRGWSERVDGLRVHDARDIAVRDVTVRVSILADGRRQCLLVVNPSSERFARGQLSLLASTAAAPFDRAVAVATAESTMAGPVHRVLNNQLNIPLALAPGEAELFELF